MAALIYLFIRHYDGMQPGGYGPLGKKDKYLERGRTNNLEVMPSPPLNKCKMQKKNVVLPFLVQKSQKATPSFTMLLP